ncbi:hypothetical protein ACFQ8O_03040 [Streptomyces coelicoflavus]|uniref:hypothetical protein n=1 Tax=Streptomyces coelicoflavus TaxID=285562 RepID=UPI0036C7374A
MTDDVRNIVLGVVAAGISATLGWLARTYLSKRKLRRKQAFFGLPDSSESLLVVNRDPAASEPAVHRFDVFALLELAALIKDCGAHIQVVTQDMVGQGFGERTEFCVGGPGSNRPVPPRHPHRRQGLRSGLPDGHQGVPAGSAGDQQFHPREHPLNRARRTPWPALPPVERTAAASASAATSARVTAEPTDHPHPVSAAIAAQCGR